MQCIALQDPYCAWNVREDTCDGAQSWPKGSQGDFLQSVPTGEHPECPGGQSLAPPLSANRDLLRLGTVINQVTGDISGVNTESHPEQNRESGKSASSPGHSLMGSENPTIEASVVLFSLETLIITVSAGAVAALVLGFVTGNLC